ncbi:MAG: HNH endonuclease signature motif containing protein [Nocardioidaceae bacterium]
MFGTDADALDDLDAPAALAAAMERRGTADRAEADLLALAAHWADLHAVLPEEEAAGHRVEGMEQLVPLAGPGTPEVAQFAAAELGAALGMTTYAAERLIGDSLELRHRLPQLWRQVHAQHQPLQAWRARRIADHTKGLSPDAAAWVDAQVAPYAHKIGIDRTLAIVEAALLRFDPEGAARRAEKAAERRGVWLDDRVVDGHRGLRIEADALDASAFDAAVDRIAEALAARGDADTAQVRRAKAVGYLSDPDAARDLLRGSAGEHGASSSRPHLNLYVHLHEDALTGTAGVGEVARVEGIGPVVVEKIRAWVERGADEGGPGGSPIQVTVTPVRDLADRTSVDGYETPDRQREVVLLRNPCCPFPWCDNLSRKKDMEHITTFVPTDEGGPPGQTAPDRLAGVCRRHHRLKTHGGWSYSMPEPGIYLWVSPLGLRYLVDHTGTTPLARSA